jgi:hypothetical protein
MHFSAATPMPIPQDAWEDEVLVLKEETVRMVGYDRGRMESLPEGDEPLIPDVLLDVVVV